MRANLFDFLPGLFNIYPYFQAMKAHITKLLFKTMNRQIQTRIALLGIMQICIFCCEVEAQERYIDPVFTEINKKTYVYAKPDTSKLYLDIYFPKGDRLDKRPAVLWMHGGGFSGGARDMEGEVKFMNLLAERGYVAISMSYRLTRKGKGFSCETSQGDKIQAFHDASSDVWRAVDFILKNAKRFKIDVSKIIAGGSSAGAEGILNAFYMKGWLFENQSEIPDFNPVGIFSCGGAMIDANYIQSHTAIPAVLFHGKDDNLVPFSTDVHHSCETTEPGYLILDGSNTISNRLRSLGTSYLFYAFEGAGHEIANIPFPYLDQVLPFFKKAFIEGEKVQEKVIIPVEDRSFYMKNE